MTLTAAARCLNPSCPWTAEGAPDTADRAAERHAREGHPTAIAVTPAKETR